jgi:hypothetical protein
MSKLPRGPDYVDTLAFTEGCANSSVNCMAGIGPGDWTTKSNHDINVSVVGPDGHCKSMFSLLIVLGLKYLQQQIICHVLYYALYMLISFCICLQTVVIVHLLARFSLLYR